MRSIAVRFGLVFVSILVAVSMLVHGGVNRPAAAPQLPVPPARPTPAPALPLAALHGSLPGWLHTAGTQIVDAAGHPVRLAAVNWYGANTSTYVPGGLSTRPYLAILRTIKAMGFNAIRLPFSNELVEQNPIIKANVDANPELKGKHALDVLDAIANGARQVGLMIILDDHCSTPNQEQDTLWYLLPHYTPQSWLNDWVTLARRYRNNPAVAGFDLRNEPHSVGPGLEIVGLGYLRQGATWGPFQGVDNPATDWRLAATTAGNAILSVNPHALIIVEGVEVYPRPNPLPGDFCPAHIPATAHYCADLYWWAGNLAGARQYPVVLKVPDHLVYSPHEYGPAMHDQRWISPHMSELAWQQAMTKHWGYLLNATGPNAAPVWVGEFGTFSHLESSFNSTSDNQQAQWFDALIKYLQSHSNAGWAYWALNGADSAASYGLLKSDWRHLSQPALLKALRSIQ